MSKKEKNAWDRFWITVKQNEKIIWVLLLLIIAPSFAFTGAFTSWMTSSSRNPIVVNVFGRNISNQEFNLARRQILMMQEFRRDTSFSTDFSGVLDYLILREEADRRGILVTDAELGAEIRRIYWSLVAQETAYGALDKMRKDATKPTKDYEIQSAFYGAFKAKYDDLKAKDVFSQKDWYDRLQNIRSQNWNYGPVPREEFEEATREAMKVEKLENYVRSTVQVTPQEAFQEYQRDEQERKLSFFEVNANDAKAEIEKSINDDEIVARYGQRKDEFKEPTKIRVDYLTVPLSAFEKQVTLTDDDLRKEYDKVKAQKYQTFLGPGNEGFELLTPEERAAREKTTYRPFEEVKEEIRTELTKTKVREAARTTAEQVKEKLFPKKEGAIGDKKEEKPAPPPATFEEIQKAFPMVKMGTTPWVERKNVSPKEGEKVIGAEAYSYQFQSWFSQVEGTGPQKTQKKDIDPPKSYTVMPSFSDPQYFIFYKKPEVKLAGLRSLDEVKEKVKETLVKEKLLEKAREKARVLAEAVRNGKKTLEEAAKEAGSQVVTTGFIDKYGAVKVPLTEEELKKAEEERKKAAPGVDLDEKPEKEKDHPASAVIRDYGFKALREKGKVEGFAEDPESGACYIVRADDLIFPDPSKFEKSRLTYEQRILREKGDAYWSDWWKELFKVANPQSPSYQIESGSKGRRAPQQVDPFAE